LAPCTGCATCRAQAFIKDELTKYQPQADDLDYPAKLEAAAASAAAAAAAAAANGEITSADGNNGQVEGEGDEQVGHGLAFLYT
jgi:hypothetical protein